MSSRTGGKRYEDRVRSLKHFGLWRPAGAGGRRYVDRWVATEVEGEKRKTSLRVVALRWERDSSGASRPVQAPAIVTRRRSDEWSLHWL